MAKEIEAIYAGGAFYPVEPVDLAEHQRVTVIVDEPASPELIEDANKATQPNGEESASAPRKPIWEIADELFSEIPEEEGEQLPPDGAAQVDHYVYGWPKRPAGDTALSTHSPGSRFLTAETDGMHV